MSQIKISGLPTGTPKGTDITPATDPTDTSSASTGTTKKYLREDEANFYAQQLNLKSGNVGAVLQSKGTGNLAEFSAATYPTNTSQFKILYSPNTDVVGEIDSIPNAALVYDSLGEPVASKFLPLDVQNNITQLNTIVVGTWNGSIIGGAFGGTNVNNGARTATYAGNLSFANSFTTSGNFAVTQTYTGVTNVTFPTSGTLATTSQIPTGAAFTRTDDTNVTLTLTGSPTTALVNAMNVAVGWSGQLSASRGGTGQNNGSNTATFAGNLNFAGAFTTSGAFAVTQTYTGITNVTFPTAGTLATTSQLPTPSALSTANDTNITITATGTPNTALIQPVTLTAGFTGLLSGTRGGTGVNNGSNTATYAGNLNFGGAFQTIGAFSAIQRYTAATDVTFPTSGTLATIVKTSRTVTSNTTLTSSDNGGIVYCNSDAGIVITLPEQSTEALPSGFSCKIINRNIGDVRVEKQGFDVFIQGNNIIGQADDADIYLINAGTPNMWQMEGGTQITPVTYEFTLPTGSNASFIVCGIIPAYTVFTQSYFKTNSGTITGVLTINGVGITGTMGMSITQNYAALTSPNVATVGSILGLTTSSNSSATFAHVTVNGYQRYYLS